MQDHAAEAREFLTSLTISLQALNATNQHLVSVLAQRVQQEQLLTQYLGYLSTQLDGVAQRLDGLETQVAKLSRILGEEEVRLPPVTPSPIPQSTPGRNFTVPTAGQFLGGVVGYGVDQLFPNGLGAPAGGGRGRAR